MCECANKNGAANYMKCKRVILNVLSAIFFVGFCFEITKSANMCNFGTIIKMFSNQKEKNRPATTVHTKIEIPRIYSC